MRRSALSLLLLATVVVCASAGPACAKKVSRTPLTSKFKELQMSPQELRIRVRALIRPTLGTVEEAADRYLREGNDAKLERSVLVWKIETTTTLLSALLRTDPVLALADAWGYAFQVEIFLARPEVEARYGTFAPSASAAMEDISKQFADFVTGLQAGATGDTFAPKIRQWAERHPIEGALYRRPSLDTALASVMAGTGSSGAFAALGSLEETAADVMMRMDLYTMYLPRLARWEGELAVLDISHEVDTKDVLADLDRFTRAADRIAGALEVVPEAVKAERIAVTHDLQEERRLILDDVRRERIAALAEIEAITQRTIDRSSGPLHDTMHKDMEELMTEVEHMRKRLNDDAEISLNNVADHAYDLALRLLLIASAIVAVFGVVGMVFVARFLRR